MPVRTALRPGVLSPTLPVPKSIPRPEYVGKETAREGSEPWVQTPEVIEKMRVSGRIAAGALAEAGKAVAPGVTTASARHRKCAKSERPTRVGPTLAPDDARGAGAVP